MSTEAPVRHRATKRKLSEKDRSVNKNPRTECGVCQETLPRDYVDLGCTHVLCRSCADNIVLNNYKGDLICPLCMKKCSDVTRTDPYLDAIMENFKMTTTCGKIVKGWGGLDVHNPDECSACLRVQLREIKAENKALKRTNEGLSDSNFELSERVNVLESSYRDGRGSRVPVAARRRALAEVEIDLADTDDESQSEEYEYNSDGI